MPNRATRARPRRDPTYNPQWVRLASASAPALRVPACLAAFLLSVGWVRNGVADPLAQVTVQWEAPASCPDRSALDRELYRDLEGSQAVGGRLAVWARVEQLGAEIWRVSIRTESGAGQSERSLTAHSCTALVDATSLIVAMIIDPETAATHARPIEATAEPHTPVNLGAPSPSATGVPSTVSSPSLSPPAANPQRRPVSSETNNQNPLIQEGPLLPIRLPHPRAMSAGLISAWAAIDRGSLPAATEVIGGSLGLMYGPWRAEAAFNWWKPQNRIYGQPPNPQAGGDFGKLAGGASFCFAAWAPRRFTASPCATLELARLSGIGNSYLSPQQSSWLLSASAGPTLLGILNLTDALAVRFDLDVLFPLNRPSFGFYSGGAPLVVFQPDLVALRAGAGVEVHFR